MFIENDGHLQQPLFSTINSLPDKQQKRLKESWADTFYKDIFARIEERDFEILYSDQPSRPNVPVNVLVGLEILKAGFGWTDKEIYEGFSYNIQVRYALGYYNVEEGHFELRTMYDSTEKSLLRAKVQLFVSIGISPLWAKVELFSVDSYYFFPHTREK